MGAGLEDWGLNATRLIAGFAGGIVHVFVFRRADALGAVGSIVAGTLTANYLGEAAGHYVGTWLTNGGAAFIVGLSAMAVCQSAVSIVRNRLTGEIKKGNGQ